MGALAMPLLTTALGVTAMVGMSKMVGNMGNLGAQQSALTQLQTDNSTALDNLPEAPEAPTNDPAADSEAEAARKEQLAALAAAEQQNMVNPTGSQGTLGVPKTSKKELLGV